MHFSIVGAKKAKAQPSLSPLRVVLSGCYTVADSLSDKCRRPLTRLNHSAGGRRPRASVPALPRPGSDQQKRNQSLSGAHDHTPRTKQRKRVACCNRALTKPNYKPQEPQYLLRDEADNGIRAQKPPKPMSNATPHKPDQHRAPTATGLARNSSTHSPKAEHTTAPTKTPSAGLSL